MALPALPQLTQDLSPGKMQSDLPTALIEYK
jgi:hypothetical protein